MNDKNQIDLEEEQSGTTTDNIVSGLERYERKTIRVLKTIVVIDREGITTDELGVNPIILQSIRGMREVPGGGEGTAMAQEPVWHIKALVIEDYHETFSYTDGNFQESLKEIFGEEGSVEIIKAINKHNVTPLIDTSIVEESNE